MTAIATGIECVLVVDFGLGESVGVSVAASVNPRATPERGE